MIEINETTLEVFIAVNIVMIILTIISIVMLCFKKTYKNKENGQQNNDSINSKNNDLAKQLMDEKALNQQKQENCILNIENQLSQNQNNDKPLKKEQEIAPIQWQKQFQQINQEWENLQSEFVTQFNQMKSNLEQEVNKGKNENKLETDNSSAAYEVNQLKQNFDLIIKNFKNIQNETNENQKKLENEFTKLLNDQREKYDSEIKAINRTLMEILNQDQLQKMVKQIQSLENCSKRLDENCTTTKLNLQSQQQDIQLTLEQFSKTRNCFEQYYNQANLPNHLKNLQELRKKLIKLIGIEDDENLIIIPFDPIRLQRTQSFVYKLYDESNNIRAVEPQYRYFVRETENFNEMAKNYSIPFSSKVELKKHCSSYKPVRGDGNCFYTAFGYQFLEFVICSYNEKEYQQLIKHCLNINLPMRLKINKHEPESVDEELQKQLFWEFFYRIQEIRKIQNIIERRKVYEKQFAAFEKQDEKIDGCLYALAIIFIRNYTDYAVEFHEFKKQLDDRANLLIWEEECQSSTEIVMQSLQKKLNLDIKLIFIQNDNSILVNKYENDSKYKIILILKPGHYGIGYFNPLPLPLPEKAIYDNFDALLEQLNLETFKNQREILIVFLFIVCFKIKQTEYMDFQSLNIIKLGAVPLEQQSIQ